MLDITDINFIMGVLDKATIQGLQGNKKIVEVAIKLGTMQESLQETALAELKKTPEPKDPQKVTPDDSGTHAKRPRSKAKK